MPRVAKLGKHEGQWYTKAGNPSGVYFGPVKEVSFRDAQKQFRAYLNTLGKYHVPAKRRHLVVMFHQRSTDFDIVMTNDAYKARYGQDNPNIALIHALKQAGVEFRACGQALAARKIDAKDVNPEIQVDLWAMTSMINLQMKGFARVG